MPKFTILVKKSFLINLWVLISNMTIVFSISSPKFSKYESFGPKRDFFFFNLKLCFLTNLRVLISNTAMFFFQILALKYPNKASFALHDTLHLINSKVLFSNMTIVFSNFFLILSKKSFLKTNLKSFFCGYNFEISKIPEW